MNTTIDKLINSKWDAISSAQTTMGNVRSDLFDNVALALSRIEGKLVFLNSDDTLDGKPRVTEGHSQEVAKQVQQEVASGSSEPPYLQKWQHQASSIQLHQSRR